MKSSFRVSKQVVSTAKPKVTAQSPTPKRRMEDGVIPSRRKSDNIPTVKLTKIKQWLFPVDIESYNNLLALGVPLVRIHEVFLPTLSLLNAGKEKKVRSEFIDFKEEILHPFLDKLGGLWQKKSWRKASISTSSMEFVSNDSSMLEDSKKKLEEVEATLRRFFERWGYSFTFAYSEKRGKAKLAVTYRYTGTVQPVIPEVDAPDSLPTISLKVGFYKVSFTPGVKYVDFNISVSAGTQWSSLATSRCLYSEISDVRPMVRMLMGIPNKAPENFDYSIEQPSI